MKTEADKRVRLNEIGREIQTMFPDLHGSVSFNYKYGKYMNKAKVEMFLDTAVGTRPSLPVAGGY